MEFKIRKYDKFGIVHLAVENQIIDLGMLDRIDLNRLRDQVQTMLDDLDWIIYATAD